MKKLNEITGRNPFKVPEDYFSNLDERILSRAMAEEHIIINKPSPLRSGPLLAIAASILLLFATGIIVTLVSDNSRYESVISDIDRAVLTESILDDIDLLILEENVEELGFVPDSSFLDTEDIIDYLVSENINDIDIFEKLQ